MRIIKTLLDWEPEVRNEKDLLIINSYLSGWNNAKYFDWINIKDLELEWWKNWTKVTNWKTWKVMKNNNSIGVKSWEESYWQRIEESVWVIHWHPITKQEYLNLLK